MGYGRCTSPSGMACSCQLGKKGCSHWHSVISACFFRWGTDGAAFSMTMWWQWKCCYCHFWQENLVDMCRTRENKLERNGKEWSLLSLWEKTRVSVFIQTSTQAEGLEPFIPVLNYCTISKGFLMSNEIFLLFKPITYCPIPLETQHWLLL